MGHFDKAIEFLRQAIQSHERSGAQLFLGQALGELGTTYLLRQEPRTAMQHLARAFEVATASSAPDAAVWAGNLAKVAIDLGEYDDAERFNREAIRLKSALKRSTLYNTYYAALIAQGRRQLAEAHGLYEEVLRTRGVNPGLRWESHDGLATVALAAGDRALATRHFEAALKIIQETRADLLRTEYRVTFLSRVTRFYRNYVGALIASGDSARALEVTDSSRGVVLAERMGGNAGHFKATSAANLVEAARQSGSIWLSYWLVPDRSYVWVVSGSGIRCVPLAGAAEIEKLVDQYRSMVERSSSDPLASAGSAGDALYTAVVAPVASFIPAGATVRIVPDGALHNVNFETLPVDGPRRHYWIEDTKVAIAPSLGLLAANVGRRPAQASASLLLVGDPTPRLKEYPRLGYAPVEMSAVAKHFDATGVVRQDGDRATPSGFLSAQPERFSVIHFTAHGAANRTSPLESAVILSGPAGADKLYARDIAERSLRAELVTISACKSAGERAYTGEGLIGFAWAFLRAGSRQVVAGLWDVDDQSTATLMDSLYGAIARGRLATDALREAKLALIAQGGHVAKPYYWGPFEVFTVAP
jgi:CHAT domain-containing protein